MKASRAGSICSLSLLAAAAVIAGCSGESGGGGGGGGAGGASTSTTAVGPTGSEPFGDVHEGSYHLGPVDFAESVFTNSCGPYPADVQAAAGSLIAGVDLSLNGDGSLCDACALVTTRLGKQTVVRIVTTGVSNAPGDMDLSQQAYDAIHEDDPQGTPENPRPMKWQLIRCPDTGDILLQFQTGANPWWTSLWVRNIALPLAGVSVKSANHADWFGLRRETDGTLNDDGGFGEGAFDLQIEALGGKSVVVSRPGFDPGSLVDTAEQL